MNEKIDMVRSRIKAAQDRQKSYADRRRRPTEFQVGDYVLLKVSPRKIGSSIHWTIQNTRSGRALAYQLELPPALDGIHNTFHVLQLRKCLADETAYVPLDDIEVDEKLNYVEKPVAIKYSKVKQLRNKSIRQVFVQWQHRKGSELTWEAEDEMRELYPELFGMYSGFGDETILRG
ncbi:uncharacterized protein LOC110906954 [Helianthus annuus]|uniref:uncharacterized protein LOC110906954 n=1 Tax=Helianthus annuus TaxID=4232 RepID=UPI000B8F6396|nr:uncharacterized protein LOC110906954 [Helianthus annuus]